MKVSLRLILLIALILILSIFLVILCYWIYDRRPFRLKCNYDVPYTPDTFLPSSKKEIPLDKTYFRTKKVIICGLLRDKVSQIEYLRQFLPIITDQFQDWSLLVVENDSADQTREELLKWHQEEPNRVQILGCGVNVSSCELKLPKTLVHNHNEKRIAKMCYLRNMYLDYIRQDSNLSTYDYVIVIDLDLRAHLYLDGIWNTAWYFNHNPTIDAISANGQTMISSPFIPFMNVFSFFDPYSLRDDINRNMTSKGHDFYSFINRYFCYGDDLKAVDSCFSGFTIYSTQSILAASYKVELDQYNIVLCEHETLNKCFKRKMYMNPSMLFLITDNKDG